MRFLSLIFLVNLLLGCGSTSSSSSNDDILVTHDVEQPISIVMETSSQGEIYTVILPNRLGVVDRSRDSFNVSHSGKVFTGNVIKITEEEIHLKLSFAAPKDTTLRVNEPFDEDFSFTYCPPAGSCAKYTMSVSVLVQDEKRLPQSLPLVEVGPLNIEVVDHEFPTTYELQVGSFSIEDTASAFAVGTQDSAMLEVVDAPQNVTAGGIIEFTLDDQFQGTLCDDRELAEERFNIAFSYCAIEQEGACGTLAAPVVLNCLFSPDPISLPPVSLQYFDGHPNNLVSIEVPLNHELNMLTLTVPAENQAVTEAKLLNDSGEGLKLDFSIDSDFMGQFCGVDAIDESHEQSLSFRYCDERMLCGGIFFNLALQCNSIPVVENKVQEFEIDRLNEEVIEVELVIPSVDINQLSIDSSSTIFESDQEYALVINEESTLIKLKTRAISSIFEGGSDENSQMLASVTVQWCDSVTCGQIVQPVEITLNSKLSELHEVFDDIPDNTAVWLGAFECPEGLGEPDSFLCKESGFQNSIVLDEVSSQAFLFGAGGSWSSQNDVFRFNFSDISWQSSYQRTSCVEMVSDNFDSGKLLWLGGGLPASRIINDTAVYIPSSNSYVVLSTTTGPNKCSNDQSLEWVKGHYSAHFDVLENTWSYRFRDGGFTEQNSVEYDPVSGDIVIFNQFSFAIMDSTSFEIVYEKEHYLPLDHSRALVYHAANDAFYYFDEAYQIAELRLNRDAYASSDIRLIQNIGGELPTQSLRTIAYDSRNQVIGGFLDDNFFHEFNVDDAEWKKVKINIADDGTFIGHGQHFNVVYSSVANVFLFLSNFNNDSGRPSVWVYRYKN